MLATAVSNNLAESRTNKFPFMAASVGGFFQFVRLWHFASFRCAAKLVGYWTNNGQRAARRLNGSVANDPMDKGRASNELGPSQI